MGILNVYLDHLNKVADIMKFADERRFIELKIALEKAHDYHNGQQRNGGEPYITHPVAVCHYLIMAGVECEATLVAALNHDVIEDTKVTAQKLSEEGFSDLSLELTLRMTKADGQSREDYFKTISEDQRAILLKLCDRWHNLCSMAGLFRCDRMRAFIDETEKFVLPMVGDTRKDYEYRGVALNLAASIEGMLGLAKEIVDIKPRYL